MELGSMVALSALMAVLAFAAFPRVSPSRCPTDAGFAISDVLCLSHGLRSFSAHIAHRPFRIMFICPSAKNTQNTSPCIVQEILYTSLVLISCLLFSVPLC
uniref:Secreted protein n=1 Tax=Ascaris lumbricoides TaxID=6252 RepID=A0A0M3HMU8_ASCLU